MSDSTLSVVLSTAPDRETAEKIAVALVEERLAACVNVVTGVRSVYRWDGRTRQDDEVLMIIKSTRAVFETLADRLKELHPYDVPEILALSTDAASAAYAAFVRDHVDPASGT